MDPIDKTYLPFSTEVLRQYLAKADNQLFRSALGDSDSDETKGVSYYETSAKRYHEFCDGELFALRKGMAVSTMKKPRQIEKDERFWTAGCLLRLHMAGTQYWRELLQKCFGDQPPIEGETWETLVGDKIELRLEAPLPSPESYTKWLLEHLPERQLIPYVRDAAEGDSSKAKMEGFTHADAVLVSEPSGFAVIFEAKVSADISYEITFDMMRNQIVRYVDVMLEHPTGKSPPLSKRLPEKTLFILVTPQMFRDKWRSRLYGRVMKEYWEDPEKLHEDLPHRGHLDWAGITRRLGWVTWEECNAILPGACAWLNPTSNVHPLTAY